MCLLFILPFVDSFSLPWSHPKVSLWASSFLHLLLWWFHQVSWLSIPPPICWWLPNLHTHVHRVCRIQRKDWRTYIFPLISILIYPNVHSTFPFWYLIGILNLRSKTKLLIFTTTSPNLHFLPYCPYQLMTVPSFQMVWPKILELFFYSSLSDSTSNSSKYCWNHLSYCNILLTVLFTVPVFLKFILSTLSRVILAKGKSNQSLLCPVSARILHFIIL